jgi:adenosylmethionine-8-amino-7-oxononanoate aminotransferase
MVLAKVLTGGYLPMAATLMTQEVFDAFLGDYGEFKTFFHGHSYFGNQLGSAVADASLGLLSLPDNRRKRKNLEKELRRLLKGLWVLPQVGDIRQVGLIAGIELVKDWKSRLSFPLKDQAGIRVCQKMAEKGVLTRPIGNVVLLMPPYCTTIAQVRKMVRVLEESVTEVFNQT